MKRKGTLLIFLVLLTILSSLFMVYSFTKSSSPPRVAPPPEMGRTPVRVYGIIEPAGREVLVRPPFSREVVKIAVKEGDTVTKGQTLCVLENEVERAQLELARAKVEAARKELAKSQDDLNRKRNLYQRQVDSEFAYTQSLLQVAIDTSNLQVALKEEELAKVQLDQLVLTSPIDGVVYKFDVRLGETLTPEETDRIILGAPELWVRLFVESYWLNRISEGSRYRIYHSETGEYLGTGQVVSRAPYVGRREFRTEDVQERFDTKFQEVVLSLEKEQNTIIPLGLSVMAELVEGRG